MQYKVGDSMTLPEAIDVATDILLSSSKQEDRTKVTVPTEVLYVLVTELLSFNENKEE